MKKASTRAEFQPGLRFSARANGLKYPQKVHVIEMESRHVPKVQREHVLWGCILQNKVAYISARVEIRHVIFPKWSFSLFH